MKNYLSIGTKVDVFVSSELKIFSSEIVKIPENHHDFLVLKDFAGNIQIIKTFQAIRIL